MNRTFFYNARVVIPDLVDGVTSGIFTSNVHPSDPRFFHDLTSAIAGEFPWVPKPSEVIITTLNLLCQDQ